MSLVDHQDLSSSIFEDLKDESENIQNWDKETIQYVMDNKKKVERSIRSLLKRMKGGHGFAQQSDIDDLYQELLAYLFQAEDYSLQKATELSTGDGIIPLESYINSCIKYCIIRERNENAAFEIALGNNIKKLKDGKEESIFDNLPDKNADYENNIKILQLSLEDVCDENLHNRYKYGLDIFQVTYIRLLIEKLNKQDKYEIILKTFNISNSDLQQMYSEASVDTFMHDLLKAITDEGKEGSLEILGRYVYCKDKIDKVISIA